MSECCHKKHKPRDEKEIKQLTNRLHRMVGQLNGEYVEGESLLWRHLSAGSGCRECFAGIWIHCFAGTLKYVCC